MSSGVLKDRDGILRAKTEIFDFLKEDGCIILNGDDDKLDTIEEVKGIKPIFFGVEGQKPVYADEIESLGLSGIACTIHADGESIRVTVPIPDGTWYSMHWQRRLSAGHWD